MSDDSYFKPEIEKILIYEETDLPEKVGYRNVLHVRNNISYSLLQNKNNRKASIRYL